MDTETIDRELSMVVGWRASCDGDVSGRVLKSESFGESGSSVKVDIEALKSEGEAKVLGIGEGGVGEGSIGESSTEEGSTGEGSTREATTTVFSLGIGGALARDSMELSSQMCVL